MSLLATLRRWRWSLVLFTVLVLLGIAGFEAWDRPARRAAQQARSALAAGKFTLAWSAVERWLVQRPRLAEAQFIRAKTALALGRSRDVLEGMRLAQAYGYPDEQLIVLRALIDAQNGRIAQARPPLEQAFAARSTAGLEPDLMLEEALTRVYLAAYDFVHAGGMLDQWTKDAPADVRPPLWHASLHRRIKAEHAVILEDYREALNRAPDNPEARLGFAEELEQMGRNPDAATEFDAYLAQRPNDPAGHLGAGRNAVTMGNEADAITHLDRALELDPDNAPARLERAKLDLRTGNAAAALVNLDRALVRMAQDPTAHYQRSLVLKRLGREREAAEENQTFKRLQQERVELETLQEQLAKTPKDVALQVGVARWMFQHGYDDEAMQWCRKILIDTPAQPDTCLLMADYFDRRGDSDQSAAFRALARQKSPRPIRPR